MWARRIPKSGLHILISLMNSPSNFALHKIHSRYEIFVTITTLSYPFHQTIFLEINKFFFFFQTLKKIKVELN